MFRADKPLPAPPIPSKTTSNSLISSRIQAFGTNKPSGGSSSTGPTAQEGKQAFSLAKKIFDNPTTRNAAVKAAKYTAENPQARAAACNAAKTLAENPQARRTAFSVANTAVNTTSPSGRNQPSAPPKLPPKQPSHSDDWKSPPIEINKTNTSTAVRHLRSQLEDNWHKEPNNQMSSSQPTSVSVKAISGQLETQLSFGRPPTRPAPRPQSDYWNDTPNYSEINRRVSPQRPPSPIKRNSAERNSFPPPQPQSPIKSKSPPPSRPPPPRSASSAGLSEPYAVAIYKFDGQNFDELSCDINDVILLKREVDNEWIYGCNSTTDQHGIIPLNFIDIKIPISPSVSAKTSPRQPSISSGPRCRALFEYRTGTEGDLSFDIGQVIRLRQRLNADWMEGETHNGQIGIFPSNFVEIIEDIPAGSFSIGAQPQTSLKIMTALYDYNSGNRDDLIFQVDDQIEILQETSADWYFGRLLVEPDRQGMVPANYVQSIHRQTLSSDAKNISSTQGRGLIGQKVTALYDYRGDQKQDLWFSAGDKIEITAEQGPDWLQGKLVLDMSNSRCVPEGMFPRTFVQI